MTFEPFFFSVNGRDVLRHIVLSLSSDHFVWMGFGHFFGVSQLMTA